MQPAPWTRLLRLSPASFVATAIHQATLGGRPSCRSAVCIHSVCLNNPASEVKSTLIAQPLDKTTHLIYRKYEETKNVDFKTFMINVNDVSRPEKIELKWVESTMVK